MNTEVVPGRQLRREIVVIGASAGGVWALATIPPKTSRKTSLPQSSFSSPSRRRDESASIDVLFHTAVRASRSRVTGVVLSGALSAGTLGLRADQGGLQPDEGRDQGRHGVIII